MKRRFFFVIDVDDPQDDLREPSFAAMWMALVLGEQNVSAEDITCYGRLEDMVADANDKAGAFETDEGRLSNAAT